EPAEFPALVRGELSPVARNRFVRHLLSDCAVCRERISPWVAGLFEDRPAAGSGEAEPISYEVSLRSATRSAVRADQRRREALREVQRVVLRGSFVSLVAQERSDPWQALARAQAWLETAYEMRKETPERYLAAARIAALAAEALSPGFVPTLPLRDLQPRAHAEAGNAFRCLDRFSEAEAAFRVAMSRAGEDTAPELLAHLLDLSSSLSRSQRRFEEADRQLRLAGRIYRQLGDRHLEGKVLIQRGILAGYRGDVELAVCLHCRAFDSLDHHRDPRLSFVALHNALDWLVQTDALLSADSLLEQAKPFFEAQAGPTERIRIRWLEARIASGLGRLHQAEVGLKEVRRRFVQLQQPYDAAIAGLHLGEVWLREGRFAELRATVSEILAVFVSLGIQREALASLVFLEHAARRERVTLDLVRAAVREVESLQRQGTSRIAVVDAGLPPDSGD